MGIRCHAKNSTNIFSARSSAFECQYITGKWQNGFQAFGNGGCLLVTNYSWTLGVHLINPFGFTVCFLNSAYWILKHLTTANSHIKRFQFTLMTFQNELKS